MTDPPCPDYTPEPVGLHPWVEGVCQYWGRAGECHQLTAEILARFCGIHHFET